MVATHSYSEKPGGVGSSTDVLVTLHRGSVAALKEVVSGGRTAANVAGFSGRHHVVLPLAGSFVWHDGRASRFADTQHVLFVPAEREYRVAHPITGDRSLVLVPSLDRLEHLAALARYSCDEASARFCRTRTIIAARQLAWAARAGADPLLLDSMILDLFALFGNLESREADIAVSSKRMLNAAKEYLTANAGDHISLKDAAEAAGANPIYLSNLFRKAEGVSLYQYLLRLRLTNALERLPEVDDLTTLAHDNGFASHSHFSAAFRARFGRSPSEVRTLARTGRPRERRPLYVRRLCVARGGDWVPDDPDSLNVETAD